MNRRDGIPVVSLCAALWWLASAAYLAVAYAPFTPDSYAYVAAATHALDFDFSLPFGPASAPSLPVALSAWPPGYPALIAILSTVFDPWAAARALALAATALALGVCAMGLRRWGSSEAGLALPAICGMTALVSATAWSEGPFLMALALACAGVLRWNLDSGQVRQSALWLAAAGLGAALLLRHAAWFVLPVLAWQLLKNDRGRIASVCALVLAVTPSALWLATHPPAGVKPLSAPNLMHLLRATGETAAAIGKLVLVPWLSSVPLQAVAGTVLLFALAGVCWRTRHSHNALARLSWWLGGSLLLGTWLLALLNPHPAFVTDRLLWPAWIFVGVALGTSLHMPGRLRALALMLLLATQTAGVLRLPLLHPRPFDAKQDFQHSAQVVENQVIVSNEAWRAWRLAGCPGYYLPRSHLDSALLAPDTLARWAAARGVTHLVWFHDGLSEEASRSRYGPLSGAGYGRPPGALELVAKDPICHTYRIHASGAL